MKEAVADEAFVQALSGYAEEVRRISGEAAKERFASQSWQRRSASGSDASGLLTLAFRVDWDSPATLIIAGLAVFLSTFVSASAMLP